MNELSVSLWLPVGRANFYSGTANEWLNTVGNDDGTVSCSSRQIDDPEYIPILQASVLRRLLEVLPRLLGYEPRGISRVSCEIDELERPVDVTMTLNPRGGPLTDAGIDAVRLYVNEHGFYAFRASYVDGSDRRQVRAALVEHAGAVFGGAFTVDRLRERRTKGYSEGAAAIRRYNGLAVDDPQQRIGPPRGALSFFQLNTLAEGLFNDTLSPAVFFEQFQFMRRFAHNGAGATTPLLTIADVVRVLCIETDAATPAGELAALHHFLAVTARESLQRLKWSVESVRRSLLDEMMGVLHRQSRLIQLDLGASPHERTPELAIGATESQLRGYVMLVSAKLPLVINVQELVQLAVDHVAHVLNGQSDRADVHDLKMLLRNWKSLLDALGRNVASLESAIEQAWMEKLLYEQEQSRSEQEAMAEIERSRRGRPSSGRVGERAYNSLMLIFTILAVVVTIQSTEVTRPGATWYERLYALWPLLAIFGGVFLIDALVGNLRRLIKERRGASESYSYEFAFRIDERTDPERVFNFLNRKASGTIASDVLPKLHVTQRGGGRIERVSTDTTLVKFHSVVTFRVSALRYARFEVVNEVLARKVSDAPRYILRQARVFGDSPRPLRPEQILDLVKGILAYIGVPLAVDGNLDDLMGLVAPFYSRRELEEAKRLYAAEWAGDDPVGAAPVQAGAPELETQAPAPTR